MARGFDPACQDILRYPKDALLNTGYLSTHINTHSRAFLAISLHTLHPNLCRTTMQPCLRPRVQRYACFLLAAKPSFGCAVHLQHFPGSCWDLQTVCWCPIESASSDWTEVLMFSKWSSTCAVQGYGHGNHVMIRGHLHVLIFS